MNERAQERGRPIAFVSSTISDFRDLRSALKYWLEEMGVEARLSEFNDFERRPEEGTFESCFKAIEGCHYYILLVGGRKGSTFTRGVSVTQQEYRVAARLASEGRITPIVFVRGEVATALAERKAIRRAGSPANAVGVSTKVLEDPRFVTRFYSEIGRTEIARKGQDPSGYMWRYPFDNFSDVVAALRVALNLHRSVRRQALLANLKWELEENIAALCHRHRGFPTPIHLEMDSIRSKYPLASNDLDQEVRMSYKDGAWVAGFWGISLPRVGTLRDIALQEAVSSGEFLDYRPQTGRLEPGDIYRAMDKLLSRIRSHRASLEQLPTGAGRREYLVSQVRRKLPTVAVGGYDLAWLYAVQDTLKDIIRLSMALLRYTMEPEVGFKAPDLTPVSPLDDMVEALLAERATHEDVEEWAGDGYLWRFLTDQSGGASLEEVQRTMDRYPYFRELIDGMVEQDLKELNIDEFKRRLAIDPQEALNWLRSETNRIVSKHQDDA